jgi:hypothetical protein
MSMNQEKLKSLVHFKIERLRGEIEELEEKGFRMMDSRKAQEEIIRVCNDRSMDFSSREFSDLIDRAEIAGKIDHITRLEETMKSHLVQIDTRFVITDGPLISPAGFTAEDKVFLQNRIMIHLDSIQDLDKVPACDVDLKVFDLEQRA